MRLSTRNIKAIRKDRKCFACYKLILKGNPMVAHNNIDPPYAFTIYLCPACHDITDSHWDFASGGDNEIYEGFMKDILQETIPKTPEELLQYLDEKKEVFNRNEVL
jgi:hypothetical protein